MDFYYNAEFATRNGSAYWVITHKPIAERKPYFDYSYAATEGMKHLYLLTGEYKAPLFYNNKVLHPHEDYIFKKSYRSYTASVETEKIVGTTHSDYCGKTWLEMLGTLKRYDQFQHINNNPEPLLSKTATL
jgi:hypothetical protein